MIYKVTDPRYIVTELNSSGEFTKSEVSADQCNTISEQFKIIASQLPNNNNKEEKAFFKDKEITGIYQSTDPQTKEPVTRIEFKDLKGNYFSKVLTDKLKETANSVIDFAKGNSKALNTSSFSSTSQDPAETLEDLLDDPTSKEDNCDKETNVLIRKLKEASKERVITNNDVFFTQMGVLAQQQQQERERLRNQEVVDDVE